MIRLWFSTLALLVGSVLSLAAQQTASNESTSLVPPLVRFTGVLMDENSKPLTGILGVTFSLYKDQQGGAPLWVETQNVQPDKLGRYSVTLGSASSQGLSADLFTAGEARWVGVQAQGQVEQARVMLVSVPYAMKAGDAATVGGLPPSAFMLATPSQSASMGQASSGLDLSLNVPPLGGGGTTNYIPIWTNSTTLGNSSLFQSGSGNTAKVGINITTPASTLDVNGGGTFRGLFSLPATGVATATGGKNSQAENFIASSFNSTTQSAVNQTFQWQAEPIGNNTSSPSGTFNLLFGSGNSNPTETGLKLNNRGILTFATGQTFPGTGSVTRVGSGPGLTGGPITGSGTLSIATGGVTNPMLQNSALTVNPGTDLTGGGTVPLGGSTTLNVDTTKVPQLNANNTFSGAQTVNGALSVLGGSNYQPFFVQSSSNFGTWLELSNISTGGHTWNILSAGGANSEGAGNLGITDLTGHSTIFLEGNVNAGAVTATSNSAINFAGFFTGWSASSGSGSSGTLGLWTFGGSGDPVNSTAGGDGLNTFGGSAGCNQGNCGNAGRGIVAGGGNSLSYRSAPAGGVFFGGSGNCDGESCGGDGIDAYPGFGATTTNGYAGNLIGDLNVTGTIFAVGKDFKIDHPLDPANKYLVHASIESSEMMNIYSGNVTTDGQGEARVQLPEWFEALNTDFRYQLTVIGQFAQAIVASEIQDHRFLIRTSTSNVKVSWQVSGVRQDAYAKVHPLVVEQEKEAQLRGFYIRPELYGVPQEKRIEWARHPDLMKRMKERRDGHPALQPTAQKHNTQPSR